MQFKNSPQRYGVVSATLHWLVAIAVYGMFALGLWMVTLSYYDGWYHQAPELHKSIGILLMMGLVIRVIWRVKIQTPLTRRFPTARSWISASTCWLLRWRCGASRKACRRRPVCWQAAWMPTGSRCWITAISASPCSTPR